jgi:hypothetical protein
MIARVWDRHVSQKRSSARVSCGPDLHASKDNHENKRNQDAEIKCQIDMQRPCIPSEIRVSYEPVVEEDQR